jgi:hypothetical protein
VFPQNQQALSRGLGAKALAKSLQVRAEEVSRSLDESHGKICRKHPAIIWFFHGKPWIGTSVIFSRLVFQMVAINEDIRYKSF